MRALVDIPEANLAQLNKLSKTRRTSRPELVRSAIAQYLQRQSGEGIDQAFGLWANRGEDGLAHQQRVRSEW